MIVRKIRGYDGTLRLINLENVSQAYAAQYDDKGLIESQNESLPGMVVHLNSGDQVRLNISLDDFYEHHVPH